MLGKKLLSCSFCGKNEKQVLKLLSGPKVQICNDCVRSCNDILGSATPSREQEQIADDQLLSSLPYCEAAINAAGNVLRERVSELRQRGTSWEEIGKALGVSRQAVWERFS